MTQLKLTSPSFKNGEWLPDVFSGYGIDVSPELNIENIAAETVSMIITLDDLDLEICPGFNHWLAFNITPVSTIPENLPKIPIIEEPLYMVQGIAYGKNCYRGPKPKNNWNHRYRFNLYTLDIKLDDNPEYKKADVLALAQGHILQTAILDCKYQEIHD